MPRYTYKCTECQHEQEYQHAMSARETYIFCPVCNHRMTRLPPRRVTGTRNANQTLLTDMNDKFDQYRYRRKKGYVR